MSSQTLGILVGGLIPAFFFGLSGVFAKAGTSAGIGVGPFLFLMGAGTACVGAAFLWLQPAGTITLVGGVHSTLAGATYGLGAGLVVLALIRFQSPISLLAPLYSMNPLVAVLFGLWVFAEWKDVGISRLLAGSVLIILGGILVSTSSK